MRCVHAAHGDDDVVLTMRLDCAVHPFQGKATDDVALEAALALLGPAPDSPVGTADSVPRRHRSGGAPGRFVMIFAKVP